MPRGRGLPIRYPNGNHAENMARLLSRIPKYIGEIQSPKKTLN